jgi:anti-anti-sigma regulatory factor
VAFPLFGKKPPASPLAAKAAARPGASAAPSAAADDLMPLDFTHAEESSPDRPRIEVQEVIHEIPQAIEQAAMLYSIEQPEPAIDVLEAAIRSDDLAIYTRRAWGMLFELYQLQSRRQEFERLAAEYAAKFETSPPTWVAGADAAAAPVRNQARRSSVVLAGMLDAASQEALKPVFVIAEQNPTVRLDVSKVTDFDDAGCALLNAVLKQLKRARKVYMFGGADKLAALLAKRIATGERDREQAWLLLLEIYQQMANQEAFDEVALNYAITFEVSPPSFEATAKKPVAAVADPDARSDAEDADECALEGVITSTSDDAFAAIRIEAKTATEVVVDVSRLERMDFVAATNLMNLASTLMAAQKSMRLIKASHLLTALWEVIGLDSVARIETRKA